eukprot:6480235-Amphidinium_carterae.2
MTIIPSLATRIDDKAGGASCQAPEGTHNHLYLQVAVQWGSAPLETSCGITTTQNREHLSKKPKPQI